MYMLGHSYLILHSPEMDSGQVRTTGQNLPPVGNVPSPLTSLYSPSIESLTLAKSFSNISIFEFLLVFTINVELSRCSNATNKYLSDFLQKQPINIHRKPANTPYLEIHIQHIQKPTSNIPAFGGVGSFYYSTAKRYYSLFFPSLNPYINPLFPSSKSCCHFASKPLSSSAASFLPRVTPFPFLLLEYTLSGLTVYLPLEGKTVISLGITAFSVSFKPPHQKHSHGTATPSNSSRCIYYFFLADCLS